MIHDPNFLHEMVYARMPFGKYEGRYITELPTNYLEWFSREGFPQGTMGQFLSTIYEIRSNGLDYLLKPLIQSRDSNNCKRK
jgi:uncharacterized protein (DUF3820 family)